MEEIYFGVKYCPHCGLKNAGSMKGNCSSCNNPIWFTISEFNSLEKQHCINCGERLKENLICDKCGERYDKDLDPEGMDIMYDAVSFAENGEFREAINKSKLLLNFRFPPERMYFVYNFLAKAFLNIFKQEYGEVDHFSKEMIESQDCREMILYARKALHAFKNSPDNFKESQLGDPQSYAQIKLMEDIVRVIGDKHDSEY